MPFNPGDEKPSKAGRKPGTPNRKTQALIDKCEEMGIDPFQGLLELSKHEDPAIKLAALKEVCSYLYPKRKAAEGPADTPDLPSNDNGQQIVKEFKTAVVSLVDERKKSS